MTRYTLRLHQELPALGIEPMGFACELRANLPVFAERAMYWPEVAWRDGEATTTFRARATAAIGANEPRPEWFLAEGTTAISAEGQPRDTEIFIANPNDTDVEVEVEFLREGQSSVIMPLTVPALRRVSIVASSIPELYNTNFSTWVRSVTDQPASLYASISAPAKVDDTRRVSSQRWQNVCDAKIYSKRNYICPPVDAGIDTRRVSTTLAPEVRSTAFRLSLLEEGNQRAPLKRELRTSRTPRSKLGIVADRTMTGGAEGLPRQWSHATLGASSTSTEWHFGDGSLADGFETFLTLANPTSMTATVNLRFLLEDEEPFAAQITVPSLSRETVVLSEYPELAGRRFAIEAQVVDGGPGIVAERSMFWRAAGYTQRSGASAAMGATHTATSWFMPEGAVFGRSNFECEFAVANPSTSDTLLQIAFILDNDQFILVERSLPTGRRTTMNANSYLQDLGETVSFSTMIHSMDDVPIIADRSMYGATLADEGGVAKFCGHASQALPLERETASRALKTMREHKTALFSELSKSE